MVTKSDMRLQDIWADPTMQREPNHADVRVYERHLTAGQMEWNSLQYDKQRFTIGPKFS